MAILEVIATLDTYGFSAPPPIVEIRSDNNFGYCCLGCFFVCNTIWEVAVDVYGLYGVTAESFQLVTHANFLLLFAVSDHVYLARSQAVFYAHLFMKSSTRGKGYYQQEAHIRTASFCYQRKDSRREGEEGAE